MKRVLAVAVLGLAATWIAGPGSAASSVPTVCRDGFASGTIDTLVVAHDSTCFVEDGTTVTRDVTVEPYGVLYAGEAFSVGGGMSLQQGAALEASPNGPWSIHGSLNATEAEDINVVNLIVQNVSIRDTTPGPIFLPNVNFFNVTVLGNTLITGTSMGDGLHGFPCIFIVLSHFGGQLVFTNNTNLVCDYIWGNTIGGNLICAANTPPPVLGGQPANTVDGNKVGQCVND